MKNLKKLSRENLKSISGGKFGSTCVIKITTAEGDGIANPQYFPGTNEQASAQCVKSIQNGSATRCEYDCAYDGYGKS